jgi:uncharacterized protein (DUF169 family)
MRVSFMKTKEKTVVVKLVSREYIENKYNPPKRLPIKCLVCHKIIKRGRLCRVCYTSRTNRASKGHPSHYNNSVI